MRKLINGNLRCMSVSLTRIPPLEVRSLNRSCTFVRLVERFFLFYFLRDASPPCILRKRKEQVAFLSGWSGLLPEIERSNKTVTISQNICIFTSSAELTLRMGRIGPKSSSWQNCQIFKTVWSGYLVVKIVKLCNQIVWSWCCVVKPLQPASAGPPRSLQLQLLAPWTLDESDRFENFSDEGNKPGLLITPATDGNSARRFCEQPLQPVKVARGDYMKVAFMQIFTKT